MRAYRTEETKGKIGENTLRTWADEVGLVVNESGDDRAGWDYILESAPEAGDEPPANPFGHSDSFPLRARVQVKATDKTDGFVDIKLSNWLRLVEDPNPSFFFIAELDGENTPQRVYLIHVNEMHWKEVLHRRRQNEVGKKKPLHKLSMRLNYREGRLLEQLNGQGLLDALAEAIGPSGSAYSQKKLERVQALGFEGGNASIRVDFPNEEGRHPLVQLADVEIGLKPSISFIRAEVYPARFDLTDEAPVLTIQGGALAMLPPKPHAQVDIRFAIPLLAEDVRFEGELYVPTALTAALKAGRSPNGMAVRVTALCFEAIARWGESSTIRYFTPEPTKLVPLKDLHTLARLTELHVRAAQEQLEVEVEVTYNGGRVVLLSGPVPPHTVSEENLVEQLSFSRLIEAAWSLARKFEVESWTEISMAQLAASAESIESLKHLVEGSTGGTLTLSWSPGNSGAIDLCDHAQDVVVVTEVELGNQRLFAATHLDGRLVIEGRNGEDEVRYRVDYSGTDHHALAAAPAGSAEPDMSALGMRSVRALGRKAIIVVTPLHPTA